MQTAGDLVGVLVKFAAGVQLRHHDFGCGDAFAVHVGRNAAAVIAHRDGTVGVQRDEYLGGVAGECFVDRVVDDFVDHVMQAGTVVGVADIHARPLAHRVEALEDLDRFCAVVGIVGTDIAGRFSHVSAPSNQAIKEVAIAFCVTRKMSPVQGNLTAVNMLI